MNFKAVIEGLLFVCGEEGLSKKQIVEILEISIEEVERLIDELINDYNDNNRGIRIEFFGDYIKLVTKKEYKDYLKKLVPDEEEFLTQSNLETLVIIAYNQPITRIQIDEIRGVNSNHALRKLHMLDLIKEIGRSDLPGHPILYGTSDYFLDYFGIKTLDDLPIIEEEVKDEEEKNLFDSKYKEF